MMAQKFKWALVAVAFVIAFGASDALSQRLELSDQAAALGAQVTFTVSIVAGQSAPIDAVGFDVTFDSSVLAYDRFTKGSLTQNWTLFDVNEAGGKLIVRGLTTDTAIQPGRSGEFVRLVFTVRDEADTTLRIVNTQDDAAGFTTVAGQFTPGGDCPTGDVNGDGSITSSDALLAFQAALGKANPRLNESERFHANVYPTPDDPDGNITSADALCIFQKALAKPSCLDSVTSSCDGNVGNNVALQDNGAVATAISEGIYRGIQHASYAIDGDPGTGRTEVAPGTFWASHWDMPAWIQVEFDRLYKIERVGIRIIYYQQTYTVKLSPDGHSWTTVVPAKLSDNPGGCVHCGDPDGLSYETFDDFAPVEAKFMRVEVTTTNAPSSDIFKAVLSEIEAYTMTLR